MSIARHHAEWLSLVPVSGPFLSLPVLVAAFNSGLEPHDPDHMRLLRQEFGTWQDSLEGRKADPTPHRRWINFVLTSTLEHDERVLVEGQAIRQTLQVEVEQHHELLRPTFALLDPGTQKPRLLIAVYPPSQSLTNYVAGSSWKASPDTRMTELLHGTGVRLGLVTNGEHWMLVDAPKGETTGIASWYGSIWLEETITLRAFRSLLSANRFFNVPDDQTLEALLAKSASNQQEVTDQLGHQVRRAVEVLIHSLDRADQDFGRQLLADVSPEQLYESALTVMMRLVFLFCAEERELIPSKPFPVYEQNYSVSTISKQLRDLADQNGEELLERRYDAWPRLLAAFRAVYGGLKHDDVYIPAYGGSLFNPDRFPFLEGRPGGTSWRDNEANPLPVNNRTVLHLLESLQLLQVKVPGSGRAESRRLSFRALDIEQIGHVYEGLLDHTARRADEPYLGLAGSRDKEPEFSLAILERLLDKSENDLIEFVHDETNRTTKAIKKALQAELDPQEVARLRTACQGDEALLRRVLPLTGLMRDDSFGYPVVIPKGSVFVTAGTDRRSSGTHYTPRSLTEPIIQCTLEPLVYVGPAEGTPKGQWKLKAAAELLELKICDMACGSGAFLVQAARYMSERLLEAWDEAQKAHPGTPTITPNGSPATGKSGEALIPDDPAERKVYAMRLIAQRCLYGVDKNPLAVEMAKLSLWLLTVAKDRPFEFLDHTIRCGDSLVGLHNLDQLKFYSLRPDEDDEAKFFGPWLDGVEEAVELRLKLEQMPTNSVEDVQRQEQLLLEANEIIARLRCAADLLVAAEYWVESVKEKSDRVRHAAVRSGHYIEKGPTEEFGQVAAQERRGQLMFHWPLEFPEVIVKRDGFDAFVGNPPFMVAFRMSPSLGEHFTNFLKATWSHEKGRADLSAYFLLSAVKRLRTSGTTGLISTKTISQEDNRRVALDFLCSTGNCIYRAFPHLTWPGAAAVHVAITHIYKGSWRGTCTLNDDSVEGISGSLEPNALSSGPHELMTPPCEPSKGVNPSGKGFIISKEEAAAMLTDDANNSEVVKCFLNGAELNASIDGGGDRYVIDFGELPKEKAMTYRLPWHRVESTVAPQRAIARMQVHEKHFWKFEDKRPELRRALEGIRRTIVFSEVSKYFAFAFVPSTYVFSPSLRVVPSEDAYLFGLLQSSLHVSWAHNYQYTLKGDPRYSIGSCFRTFPFPRPEQEAESLVRNHGECYHEARSETMRTRSLGLRRFYDAFHDQDEACCEPVRQLQVTLDKSVAAAYGWTDLELGHGFHATKQGIRFTISEPARRKVLQRLLKLNHELYAEEVRQGLHDKKKPKKAETHSKPKKVAAKAVPPSPLLFEIHERATFPSTDTDRLLCGLVCDFIAADSGLQSDAYIDELVIALNLKRHSNLLLGTDRSKAIKLSKKIPLGIEQIPWSELVQILALRKAIRVDSGAIHTGPEWSKTREAYPAVDPELLALIRKAAIALRNLQAEAASRTQEEDKILGTITEERSRLCRVAS